MRRLARRLASDLISNSLVSAAVDNRASPNPSFGRSGENLRAVAAPGQMVGFIGRVIRRRLMAKMRLHFHYLPGSEPKKRQQRRPGIFAGDEDGGDADL